MDEREVVEKSFQNGFIGSMIALIYSLSGAGAIQVRTLDCMCLHRRSIL